MAHTPASKRNSVLITALLLTAQLSVVAFSSVANLQRAEATSAQYKVRKAWNFTPADYTKLKASGGELKFSERSQWVPALLQESILGVLKFVLDENLKPSSTAGINRMDFYHGHLNCVSPNISLQELAKKFEADKAQAFNDAGLKAYLNPTKQNFKVWAPVIDSIDAKAGEVVSEMIRRGDCENALIQYHTFEYNNEDHGVTIGDMRRHLNMRLGDREGKVLRIAEKPRSDLMEFKIDLFAEEKPPSYFNMFNFGFLIEPNGVIHVTEGSQLGLHRFTGVKD